MNRRDDHVGELLEQLAYDMLHRLTFGLATTHGYAPHSLKLAHEALVERGFEPLPHLSEQAYATARQAGYKE